MSGALRFFTTRPLAPACAPQLRSWMRAAPSPVLTLSCNPAATLRSVSHQTATAAAAPRKARGRKKKSSSSSSSSDASTTAPPPQKRRPQRAAAATSPAVEHTAAKYEDDSAMAENDVRLAMRMLMSAHFHRQNTVQRHGDAQLEKEREDYRERHEDRERRLMMKDENSMRLLGGDGRSIGDGIVPIIPMAAQSPFEDASGGSSRGVHGAAGSTAVWRSLNPVGLAASQAVAAQVTGTAASSLSEEDYAAFLASSAAASTNGAAAAAAAAQETSTDLEDWKSVTLATLCAPNLSVYDTDHDFRVSSEDVVQQSKQAGRRTTTPALSDPTRRAFAFGSAAADEADMDADLPATAAAQLKRQFAEDEDPDHAVSFYTDSSDEDVGPFQL